MSFKIIECGTNRNLVCELLVVYSNFRRITHRFRDTNCFNAENYILPTRTGIWPWIWRSSRWNMETKFGVSKLESWDCQMVKNRDRIRRTMWAQVWQTDGQIYDD